MYYVAGEGSTIVLSLWAMGTGLRNTYKLQGMKGVVAEGGKLAITVTGTELIGNGLESQGMKGSTVMLLKLGIAAGIYGGLDKIQSAVERRDIFHYYMDLVEQLNVSTEPNTATFYSGPGNRELAEAFAISNGKTTLEMTPGGQYLDNLKLFGEDSMLTERQAKMIWARLSERYAQNASGNVYGFVEGAKLDGIFETVERPALETNININITNIFTELFKQANY